MDDLVFPRGVFSKSEEETIKLLELGIYINGHDHDHDHGRMGDICFNLCDAVLNNKLYRNVYKTMKIDYLYFFDNFVRLSIISKNDYDCHINWYIYYYDNSFIIINYGSWVQIPDPDSTFGKNTKRSSYEASIVLYDIKNDKYIYDKRKIKRISKLNNYEYDKPSKPYRLNKKAFLNDINKIKNTILCVFHLIIKE